MKRVIVLRITAQSGLPAVMNYTRSVHLMTRTGLPNGGFVYIPFGVKFISLTIHETH